MSIMHCFTHNYMYDFANNNNNTKKDNSLNSLKAVITLNSPSIFKLVPFISLVIIATGVSIHE